MINGMVQFLKGKASSTTLITLICFYIICNARWIFVSFFASQDLIFEKTGLLKNEYIYQEFNELHTDNIEFWLANLILPLIFTYLYTIIAPLILYIPCYYFQLKYHTKRREMEIKNEKKLLETENKILKQKAKNTEAKIELQNKESTLKDDTISIEKQEYKEFINSVNGLKALKALKKLIYQDNGDTSYIDTDLIILLDVNELIEYDGFNRDYAGITEKGKHFIKMASTDNML